MPTSAQWLKMAQLKPSISKFAPGEEDDFAKWAFGDDYGYFTHGIEFFNAWNELHSEELMLKSDSRISEDIPKMIECWRRNG